MSKDETTLRALANDTVTGLAAWRDEVKVRLHLAEMDARDAWKDIEPHVATVEGALRKTLDAVVPGGSDQVRLELHLGVADARDRLVALEPKLEAIGHDLAKAGRDAIGKLKAELGAAVSPRDDK